MTKSIGARDSLAWRGLVSLVVFGSIALSSGTAATPAFAQSLEEQITNALHSSSTRAPSDKDAEERRLIDSLRARPARSVTAKERELVTTLAEAKPHIDLEINFDYNSDTVGVKAEQSLLALGRALSMEEFKGATFLINGHTDAKGGDDYNQNLSERRAEAVKRLLIQRFNLPADTLIAVGFGKTHLKNQADPSAGENRRVQIVNTEIR
jgi:outer membrane protein OmpA-like peptidoglycan-associated protein